MAVRYVAKKAFFSFLGNTFRIYEGESQLKYYIKQKAFKLKEEINVFADEKQTQKLITIKARGIGDFSGTYDVSDANTGEGVGAAGRQGLKSTFGADEWDLMDSDGALIGKIKDTGGWIAVLRKYIAIFKMIPQTFEISLDGNAVGKIKQRFNPFQLIYDVEFGDGLDERLGVAATVLLLAIEGSRD